MRVRVFRCSGVVPNGDGRLAGKIIQTVREGIADGFGQAMLVAAVVAAAGAVYVAARTPRTSDIAVDPDAATV